MKNKTIIPYFIIIFFSYNSAVAQQQKSSVKQDSISFISSPSGYKMAETFSYSSKENKQPAIILIWGSGPHTREQVISKFPMFKIMVDYFNERGYAVLRIDKRGFGKSEGPKGSESQTITTELADDIYSALQFLKKQPNVDTANIGLIGHSEGAWIAEMIALKDSSIKWITLLGAHIVSGEETQMNQMCANLLRMGAKPEVVAKVRPQIKRYIDFIKTGYSDDSVYYSIGTDFLLAHGMEQKDITHKLIDQLLDGFKTPWYKYYFSKTPADLIQQLKIPAYFIYGGDDENVIPEKNLPALLSIINKSTNKNMQITVLPGLDHFFEVQKEKSWTLSDKLCPTINFWVNSLTESNKLKSSK